MAALSTVVSVSEVFELRVEADVSVSTVQYFINDVAFGAAVTGATSLLNPSAGDLWIASMEQVASPFTGVIYWAEVRDGIDGPVVRRYDGAEHGVAQEVV